MSAGFLSDDDESNGVDLFSGKIIHDPIHGQITLEPLLLQLLDTPQFQRLRDLKQLGCAYLVFPGGSHNRFEHCIGVAHLAEQMLHHLQSTQIELNITAHDILLVKIAGLSHDLGHGPFSHMFEEFVHAANPNSTFRHERMSLQMLEWIVEENGIDINATDMQFLRECINPYDNPSQSNPKKFLYDVVANARNSVDVDKFDYLARDCHNLGMSTNLKHDRLMRHCRVIDGEICFNSKEVYNLYELFHTRYSLFKQVYSHRVSKSIEYMICDVFLLADPILHLSKASESPQAYAKLTDCILKQIETSTDPRLQPARDLIERIRRRQLYRLVDETVLPVDCSKVLDAVTAKQILDCYLPSRSVLSEDDLHVQNLRINYAMKDKNPVDSIRFFHKSHPNHSFYIPKHKVSHVIPQHFQERILRVFLRDVTDAKLNAASEAITYFLQRNQCISPGPPIRSSSSPSALTHAQPIRGGSLFTRVRSSPPITAGGGVLPANGAASIAEEEGEDDGIPLSQGTAATAEQVEDEPMPEVKDFSVNMNSFATGGGAGRSESVMSRLLAASNTPAASAASSSPHTALTALPSTPTRPSTANGGQTDSPPTIKLDRHGANAPTAHHNHTSNTARSLEFATPATAGVKRPFQATAAATPAAASVQSRSPYNRDGENCSPCPTPAVAPTPTHATHSVQATPTPFKRRNVLSKPATPVGKMAAQAAAAARGMTPAALRAASARGTPAQPTPQQQQAKKQKLSHNLPTPSPTSDRRASPRATPSPPVEAHATPKSATTKTLRY